MVTPSARRALARIQAEVLSDGKVDWEETGRLLAFIRPYVEAGSRPFVRLAKLLEGVRADGVITRSESEQVVAELGAVQEILVRQAVVEKVLLAAVAVVLAVLVLVNWT